MTDPTQKITPMPRTLAAASPAIYIEIRIANLNNGNKIPLEVSVATQLRDALDEALKALAHQVQKPAESSPTNPE